MVDGNVIDVSSCGIAQRGVKFSGVWAGAHEPSLGLLLADALRFISHGNWWLVLFPGLMLFTLVMLFDQFARATQRLWLRSDVC